MFLMSSTRRWKLQRYMKAEQVLIYLFYIRLINC